ncbi:MAG: hypothetical protein Q4G70_04460 [Pseudomonadota bacterium]|nr:hypothetical protein [Pseudomonadota bacterium]
MKLAPYQVVDGLPWTVSLDEALMRFGPPQRRQCNAVGLDELDYGHRVLRFQCSTGRLEEVTCRAPVLYLLLDGAVVDVPFAGLADFVRARDGAAFERLGFLVSSRFGLAFVPGLPDWVTALAAHCIGTWRGMLADPAVWPGPARSE